VPSEVVSKRLGHSDISITYDRYIRVYRDRDAEAAAFARIGPEELPPNSVRRA
jgi:integrase